MENDVLGTGRVLENGEDGGHGAAKVGDVEGHCNVDCVVGAVGGVVELWGFFEARSSEGGIGGADIGEEKEDTDQRRSR